MRIGGNNNKSLYRCKFMYECVSVANTNNFANLYADTGKQHSNKQYIHLYIDMWCVLVHLYSVVSLVGSSGFLLSAVGKQQQNGVYSWVNKHLCICAATLGKSKCCVIRVLTQLILLISWFLLLTPRQW